MKTLTLILFSIFILAACQDSTPEDIRVGDIEGVEVPINTPFEDANLPSEIPLIVNGSTERMVRIDWEETRFDEVRRYIVNGTVDLDSIDFEIPSNLPIHISVDVVPRTILESLTNHSDTSIFYQLIAATQLDDILSLEGPFTVFAPSDTAFLNWFELFDTDLDTMLEQENIEDILLYHILNGNYSRNVLIATVPGDIMTLGAETINVSLSGANIRLNTISSITSTEEAQNGYVHVIDEILISQTQIDNIFEDLFDEDLFAFLMAALQDSDIPLDLLLEGNVTIFLPNETAWETFFEDEERDIETFITSQAFIDILSNHIFAGRYTAENLYGDAPINIRNIRGDLIRVDVIDDQLTIKGALLESTEMFGEFAIIHIIDEVLIAEEE